jgi:hypothetical protein
MIKVKEYRPFGLFLQTAALRIIYTRNYFLPHSASTILYLKVQNVIFCKLRGILIEGYSGERFNEYVFCTAQRIGILEIALTKTQPLFCFTAKALAHVIHY